MESGCEFASYKLHCREEEEISYSLVQGKLKIGGEKLFISAYGPGSEEFKEQVLGRTYRTWEVTFKMKG